MQNLPQLTIITDSSFYTIPTSGNLESNYKPLRNIQLDDGTISDFNTNKIKFDLQHPLDIEIQPSYDGSNNLIINDDKNPPLLINTRFSVEEDDTYIIPDHSGSNDTNLYSESTLELDIKLYKTITKIPKLEYLGLNYNGKMKCGNYNFYFKYSDVDNNETDFITESGLVTCHIGNINDPYSIRLGMEDEDSKKSIKFKLSNIDTQYDLVKIYYTRSTSDNSGQIITTAHYIDNKYIINGDSLELLITGFENHFDIPLDEINLIYELANSVKTQAQCQNRLFFGNINKPYIPYQELTDLSLRIIPSISQETNIGNIDYNYIDRSGKNLWEYYNTKNIYNYLGYWNDEYYRFGIVYILSDFTLSPVFNIRGLDLSLNQSNKLFDIYDENGKRIYIDSDSDGYIINKSNDFENIKGVIKFPNNQVIFEDGVKPLGIKFTFQTDDNNLNVIDELKKYTKGFFFVRQKRIPTILAQGCTIGKTKDAYGNIPILSINNVGVSESFLSTSTESVIKESNPFLVKKWVWRYPKYYLTALNTLIPTNIDDELSEDNVNHPLNWKLPVNSKLDEFNKNLYNDGDRVRSKYRTSDRIGDPIYGCWDILGDDSKIEDKLKDTFGSYFRILKSRKVSINRDNYDIKAGIFPEVELRESLFNQIFTSSKFTITPSKSSSSNKITKAADSDLHYYLVQDTENSNSYIKSAIVTIVNDNLKLISNGSDLFSARAGESKQAWDVVDVKYNWETETDSSLITDTINSKLTNNIDYIRGSFGTYVGFGDISLNEGEIINIRPEDYNDSIEYKKSSFKTRFSSFEPYFSISERIDYDNIIDNIISYRGDCFIGNFTHRMHRNFSDPDLPTNDKIIDPYTWYKGFVVKQEVVNEGKEINRILTSFKRNNKGKILEPEDSKFSSAGSFKDSITGLESYTISGSNKINRADVNAVKLGHWFTFKVMSNINISFRDINLSNPSEQSIFGNPRGFFPLNKMSLNGTSKLPDSNIINGSLLNTLSNKYNFIIPDVPYIKNKFSTRIQYSDISINDAYRNGYRIFRGGNYKDIPKTYGSLISLKELSGNLIAVMENGVLLIPVNERVVSGNGDGGEVFINTSNILPENPRVLSSNFGSIWKDSILETINTVYGFDTISKKIWKTDGQSFTILSDLKMQKFLNDNIDLSEFDKSINLGIRNVKTHFNALKGDVMFTFYNNDNIWNLCYNEKLDKFITLYSWIPSFSENIHNVFISFNLNTLKSNLEEYNKYIKDNNYIPSYEINYLWKHGKAGNYDLEEDILPTKWYGKQELFEFEFIVKDPPITQKIFDNLKIISNKSKPKEFEFEIVGESYDWYNFKDEIIFINSRVSTFNTLEDSYKQFLIDNPSIKKIPFLTRSRINDGNLNKDYEFEDNSTNVKLIEDKLLNEYRINSNQLGNDIKSVGRIKGNMQYLEDLWNVELRPINFKYAYLKNNNLYFTKINQHKIRDKYLKIKVRYSGEDLTIIQAIKTIFTISYA